MNFMKKYIIGVCLLTTILAACNKRLDVVPTQSIGQDQALLQEKDVIVTLIGAYDGLQSTAAWGGDIHLMNELTGNSADIRFTGTFAGLSAIDKITSSPATKNRVEGEALFIRASLYFELVNLFAKAWGDGNNATNLGVPLVLTPTTSITDADYLSRNTVADVYQKVITDLERAESLLPNTNGIYATKNAAAAILSRVFLMQADYAKARDAANRVITSNRQTLSPTFAGLWFTFINNAGNSPAEYIFSMKVTAQDGANGLNTFFGTNAGAGTAGRSDCKIFPAHLAKYEAGDDRLANFVVVGGNNYTRKHLDRFGNVCIVRLGEMYLTRAEANLRLGTSIGDTPLNDVNTIRNRSNLADLVTVDLNAVLNERYLELAFEGQRLHDIKRTRGTQSGTAWNSPKLILPIPQREIDVNKNLTQNEGYF
jgi:starch-binding outer membrane protein, SusD/RagB family